MAKRKVSGPDAFLGPAMQLFEKKGYRNTTIDDIAEAAGVARPTVYQYVKSKSSLLEQAFSTVLTRLDDDLRLIRAMPQTSQQIVALVNCVISAAAELQPYFRIFFGEELELPTQTQRQFRAWSRRVTNEVVSIFEEARSEALVRPDVDPKVAAFLLIGMLTSISRWYAPNGPLAPSDLADQALRLLSGYVSPAVLEDSRLSQAPWNLWRDS